MIVNKMAGSKMVICNALCFLLQRFGKSAVKHLKSALLDFYDVKDLCEAKRFLLDDVRNSDISSDLPHIPDRREGELRAVRTVDDIISIVSALDEKLLLGRLSKYVADSPDAMPATRLYEGDLAVVMKVLEKLNGQVGEFDVKLAAMLKEVQSLQHLVNTGVRPLFDCGPDGRCVSGSRRAMDIDQRDQNIAGVVNTAGDILASGADMSSQVNSAVLSATAVPSWAAAVAASSPVVFRSYRSAEATDQDSDGQFVEYESRRSAKRRRRASRPQQQQPLQQQPQQPQQSQQTQQSQQSAGESSRPRRQRGGRVMRGSAASEVRGLTAAKHIVDKAVFCVDNVDPSVDVNKMKDFVASLSVNVISCFRTAPRRRRGESGPVTDRGAFRLCIAAADRDRLLDETRWPDSVVISKWYYIAPSDVRRPSAVPPPDGGRSSTPAAGTSAGGVTAGSTVSPLSATPSAVMLAADNATDGGLRTAADDRATEPAAAPLRAAPSIVSPAADDDDMDDSSSAATGANETILYHHNGGQSDKR